MTRGADYATRATQHRPKTVDEMRVAVHELRSRGYTDHGIAQATGLSVEYVRRALGAATHSEPLRAFGAMSAPTPFYSTEPSGTALDQQ